MTLEEKVLLNLEDALYEEGETRKRLMSQLEWVRSNVNSALERMKEDRNYYPNSIGVIQGSGVALDLLCAQYYDRLDNVKRAKRLARGLPQKISTQESTSSSEDQRPQ